VDLQLPRLLAGQHLAVQRCGARNTVPAPLTTRASHRAGTGRQTPEGLSKGNPPGVSTGGTGAAWGWLVKQRAGDGQGTMGDEGVYSIGFCLMTSVIKGWKDPWEHSASDRLKKGAAQHKGRRGEKEREDLAKHHVFQTQLI